jgi:hypothetical protein
LLRLTVNAVAAFAPPTVVMVTVWPDTDAVTAPARKPLLAVTAVAAPESSVKPAGKTTFIAPFAGMALTVVSPTAAVPTFAGASVAGVTLVPVSVPIAIMLAATAVFWSMTVVPSAWNV